MTAPESRASQAEPEAGEATIRSALGGRIRAARQERGLSTVQVARAVGVSPSLISQVERGLTAPSLDVLEGIARTLEVSIGSLFDGEAAALPSTGAATLSAHGEVLAGQQDPLDGLVQGPARAEIVRASRRKTLGLPGSITYELLSPDLKHQIELIWVEFAPGQRGPIYSHEGEEQMVVIRGRMHYWVAGEQFVLEAGDCITIDASQPHGAANLDAEPATIVAAITPPSF